MRKPSRASSIKLDPGKQKCQQWHAKKRARERLGIHLSNDLIDQIVSAIKKNKENDNFRLKFVEFQSKRLMVYDIVFTDKEPVKLVYDRMRETIVTFLYPEDASNVYHYYDKFGNKVNLKHECGKIGQLIGDDLIIPGETIVYEQNQWTVTDGILKGKRFEIDLYGDLSEIGDF